MMYSCALWGDEEGGVRGDLARGPAPGDLEAAQMRKIHHVLRAARLKPGDRVAMEPGIPCRRCVRCKDGHYNLCPDMAFAATPPFDGTLARYYTLPEDFCYKLPENVSLEEGALVEPASVGVHICRMAGVVPGESVVSLGFAVHIVGLPGM